MTRLAIAVFLACLAGACSSSEQQTADPAEIERLLASFESRSDTQLSAAAQTKLQRADRLAGAISRVEPKRIDPKYAVALLAR